VELSSGVVLSIGGGGCNRDGLRDLDFFEVVEGHLKEWF
jgi:hypothetical protein